MIKKFNNFSLNENVSEKDLKELFSFKTNINNMEDIDYNDEFIIELIKKYPVIDSNEEILKNVDLNETVIDHIKADIDIYWNIGFSFGNDGLKRMEVNIKEILGSIDIVLYDKEGEKVELLDIKLKTKNRVIIDDAKHDLNSVHDFRPQSIYLGNPIEIKF